MQLTDNQIVDLLIEYTTDDRYKQAVLIDGDWGSGKTYFVQEKLVKSLKAKFKVDQEHSYDVLYISLYGTESFSQIMDDIYTATLESFFDKRLGDGIGEKVGKGINFTSKLLATGMKYFNLDKDDLPKLADIKGIRSSIIIFDDLERCSINTNQLLGFINNLVEHNAIKVIIVANQAEIGKPKLIVDLPQKYSVVLNPQLKHEEAKDEKNKHDQEAPQKQIGYEELKKYTEQLFSEDLVYEKVKEKLIGLTINYRADFNVIYKEIVCKYIKDETTKERLVANKELVVDAFFAKKHHNIRTLIFSLMATEKIFATISEIHFEPAKFIEEQYIKLLQYIVAVSIQIKTGQPLYSWKNVSSQTGTVYLEKDGVWGKSIFGYRFVDLYLTTRFFDPSEVKTTIFELMNEHREIERCREAENALSYNTLYAWWYLEDEEVRDLVSCTIVELSEMKYHPRYFKDMIILLMQLQHANFSPFDYPKTFETFISFMKQRLEENDDEFKIDYFEVLSDNSEFIQKYNLITKPLFDVLRKKEREEKEKINENLDLDESWGDAFKSSCTDNRNSYITGRKFLFYVSPEKVINKLRTSTVKEIYSFLDGIKEIYSFSNLNEFFKDDVDHISEILNALDIDILSDGKTTKRIVLEKLKKKLEESLTLIQQ